MAWKLDARVPLRFGPAAGAGPDEALLVEGALPPGRPGEAFAPEPGPHPAGCACCLPRNGAGRALGRLFARRARGEVPFFRAVLADVSGPGRDAVLAALADDPLTAALYRHSPATKAANPD